MALGEGGRNASTGVLSGGAIPVAIPQTRSWRLSSTRQRSLPVRPLALWIPMPAVRPLASMARLRLSVRLSQLRPLPPLALMQRSLSGSRHRGGRRVGLPWPSSRGSRRGHPPLLLMCPRQSVLGWMPQWLAQWMRSPILCLWALHRQSSLGWSRLRVRPRRPLARYLPRWPAALPHQAGLPRPRRLGRPRPRRLRRPRPLPRPRTRRSSPFTCKFNKLPRLIRRGKPRRRRLSRDGLWLVQATCPRPSACTAFGLH